MADSSITSLQVVVKSDGIDQAAASLKVLVAAAAEAGVKVSDFVTKLKPLPKVQEDATDKAEKLIAAFKQQVALLGANQAAVNSYKTTMKEGTSAQVEMASSLGSEVDAYRAKVAAQKISTAETLKNEKATIAATEATRLFNAAVADNRVGPTRQTFSASKNDASVEAKYQSDLAKAIRDEVAAEKEQQAIQQKRDMQTRTAEVTAYVAKEKELTKTFDDAAKAEEREAKALSAASAAKIEAAKNSSANVLAGDKWLASLNSQAATVGLVGQKLRDYTAEQQRATAALHGLSSQAEPAIKKLQETERAAGNAHSGVAGITREFIVLGHEMSQGQFTRFGGSMMVLAEKFNVAKIATNSFTGAMIALDIATAPLLVAVAGLTAVAAAIGVMVYASYQGDKELLAMNNALIHTGNFAGATGTQLMQMAHEATKAGGSIREAKKAITELAETGKFTKEQLGNITTAVIAMEHSAGVPIDETISQFKKLAAEVDSSTIRSTHAISKHAAALSDQYRYMNLEQYKRIRAMEDEGNAAGALDESLKIRLESLKKQVQESESLLSGSMKTLHSWMDSIGAAWDKLTAKETSASKKSKLQDKSDFLDNPMMSLLLSNAQVVAGKAKFSAQIAAIDKKDIDDAATAKAEGVKAQLAAQQIHAQEFVDGMNKLHNKTHTAEVALAEYDASWEKVKNSASLKEIATHDKTRIQMVKDTQDKIKKIASTEGSGYALAIEDVKGPADARKKIYEDAIKLIDAEVKYKVKSTEEGAKETEAILKAEHESAMALFKDEIDITAKFRRGELNQLNEMDKNKKKYESDRAAENAANLLRLKTNLLAEEYAAGEGERYAEKAFNTSQKNLTKENDLLRDKLAAYKALPDAMRKAGVTEKQMADLATQNHIDRLQAQVGVGPRSNEENDRLMSQIAELKEQKKLLEKSEGNDATNKAALENTAEMKSNSKKIGDDLANAILEGGTQGYGKLIKNMTMDFARMVLRPILQPAADGIAKLLGGGGSAAASGLGLGGLAADAASWFGAAPAVSSMGGGGAGALMSSMNMADGGDVSAGNTHIVGERGAELFVPKSAGTIVPTGQFNNDKGTTIHYSPNISIDSRSDQAQIHAMVSGAVRQGQADLVEKLSRAGRI